MTIFNAKAELPDTRHSQVAAVSALIYVAFCSLYILISGRIAAATASSTQHLQSIETIKGIAFICVTGGIFFVVLLMYGHRIQRQQQTILAQQNALRQNERKAVAAMCAASVAHDLNNLLMSLEGLVESIRDQEGGNDRLRAIREEIERSIDRLAKHARRVATTVRQVLPDERDRVDLQDLVGQVVDLVRKHPDVRHCSVTVRPFASVVLALNEPLLDDALLNLLINAAQAAGPRGSIELHVAHDSESVTMEVHDSGPGVPESLATAIFDPCYTTKPSGTGVGLLAVTTFCSTHGADVTVGRSPLGGARFRIRIPLAPAPRAKALSPDDADAVAA